MRKTVIALTVFALLALQGGLTRAEVCLGLSGQAAELAQSSHCSQKTQPPSGCCKSESCRSFCQLENQGLPVTPPVDREAPTLAPETLQVAVLALTEGSVEFPSCAGPGSWKERPLEAPVSDVLLLKVSFLI